MHDPRYQYYRLANEIIDWSKEKIQLIESVRVSKRKIYYWNKFQSFETIQKKIKAIWKKKSGISNYSVWHKINKFSVDASIPKNENSISKSLSEPQKIFFLLHPMWKNTVKVDLLKKRNKKRRISEPNGQYATSQNYFYMICFFTFLDLLNSLLNIRRIFSSWKFKMNKLICLL